MLPDNVSILSLNNTPAIPTGTLPKIIKRQYLKSFLYSFLFFLLKIKPKNAVTRRTMSFQKMSKIAIKEPKFTTISKLTSVSIFVLNKFLNNTK